MYKKLQALEKLKRLLAKHETQMVEIRKRMKTIRSGKLQESRAKPRIPKS